MTGGTSPQRGLWLDPRTKILLLLLCIFSAMIAPSLYYELGLVVLIGLFGVCCGKWKYAWKGVAFYALVVLLTFWIMDTMTGTWRTMFIAFLGLQNVGLVAKDASTGVTLGSFNLFNNANVSWATVMPMIVTVLALVLIAVLSKKGVRGAVLWGILGGAALYYVLGLTVPGFYGDLSSTLKIDFVGPFRDFGEMAFGKVFTEGFDFSAYVSAHGTADLVVVFITTSLAFCMVDMFDTLGTLYGACARGNMLLPNGEVPNMDKAMLADAIATTTGAICGTSTVTTFVESSAGVAEGGRTGLAAMATAALFFIAMFLSPIASLIPTAATAAALIYVGVLMINCVKDLDWMDPSVALPSFLTMAMMPFTYNISYGIAFGLISYVLIRIFTGKIREVKVGTWVITILFLLMLFLTH